MWSNSACTDKSLPTMNGEKTVEMQSRTIFHYLIHGVDWGKLDRQNKNQRYLFGLRAEVIAAVPEMENRGEAR